MFTSSGLVGLATGSRETYEIIYLILGPFLLLAELLGTGASRRNSQFLDIQRRSVLGASIASLLSFLGLLILAFWLSGKFGGLNNILLEAVSGVTATNLTTVNPEEMEQGVLFMRAFSQWAGGFGAICFFSALLPVFTRGREHREYGKQIGSTKTERVNFYRNISQIFYVYSAASLLLFVGYQLTEMGFFDAVTHSFTTISTGGFSNYSDGLAHFGSSSVEWIAISGMLVAGITPAFLVWIVRGSPGVLWRSPEMRFYVLIIFFATLTLSLTAGEGVRQPLFSVTSAVSSTGFYLQDWAGFGFGLQMMMLLIIATGTMSGTAGGGFGLTRALEAVSYIYREIVSQLHSKVVFKIKIGRQVVGEESLANTQSFQFFFIGSIALGAFLLAQFGLDFVSAVSGAVSALATMGPGIGDIFSAEAVSDSQSIAGLSAPVRATLSVLMLVGRISIFPIMILFFRLSERVRQGR